jgi:hypothetical protein
MTSPAFVGTRPQRPREPAYNRDSNALRASVLDVAWQLGIGTSRAVERLMFDSVLEEEEEVSKVFFSPSTSPIFSRPLCSHPLKRKMSHV